MFDTTSNMVNSESDQVILLVDDDRIYCRARKYLNLAGYKVVTVLMVRKLYRFNNNLGFYGHISTPIGLIGFNE